MALLALLIAACFLLDQAAEKIFDIFLFDHLAVRMHFHRLVVAVAVAVAVAVVAVVAVVVVAVLDM